MQPSIHAHKRHKCKRENNRLGMVAQDPEQHADAGKKPDHGIARRILQRVPPRCTRRYEDVVGPELRKAARGLANCQAFSPKPEIGAHQIGKWTKAHAGFILVPTQRFTMKAACPTHAAPSPT
jgi:hypothetical protein